MEACKVGPGSIGVITMLSAWGQQSACLTSKGKLLTWGKGEHGRLGHGDENNRTVPTLVKGFVRKGLDELPIKMVAVGQYCMMALTRDSNLYAWGRNRYGELGLSSQLDPVRINVGFASADTRLIICCRILLRKQRSCQSQHLFEMCLKRQCTIFVLGIVI